MNVLSMHALIGAYSSDGRVWMEELKKVLESNINLVYSFFQNEVQGVSLRKPEGTYVVVPNFENWCKVHGRTFDELLRSGVEVGVLWRDGRQFHIPYGIRLALGLPTQKLEEVLHRLKQYVL
ncbi:cystathione beta-lyase [Lactonifactor longoviformis DSM 17459]|uniref:Cystathione beta-lyase n=2 Tax=Lactonifactor TaxID=420345 RepID=A0A1M4T384_9CLOT|nr:cystathione beta-lyase [Lactonifactor longoviformis DSM 17459]